MLLITTRLLASVWFARSSSKPTKVPSISDSPWRQHLPPHKHWGRQWLVKVEPCQRDASTYSHILVDSSITLRSPERLSPGCPLLPLRRPEFTCVSEERSWLLRRLLTTWGAVRPRRTVTVRIWQKERRSRRRRRLLRWRAGVTRSAWRRWCPAGRRTESPPSSNRRCRCLLWVWALCICAGRRAASPGEAGRV